MSISLFAILNHRFGQPIDATSRRQFLKTSLALGAGLLPSNLIGADKPSPTGKRVVVVGAGFAGLACAYELQSAGYDVTVVEARNRISGRVRSFNKQLGGELISGKNVEGGGELIGSNHRLWVSYADQFKLDFLDVGEEELEAPIILEGRKLTEKQSNQLWEEMDAALSRMNQAAAPIHADAPWKSPDAEALDHRSLQDWIDGQQDVSSLCRRAIAFQETANNGVDTRQQSLLGNLTTVKGGGLEKYWTESEVYRCRGGNQQLAVKFAEQIGPARLLLGLPVVSIEQLSASVRVTCGDGRVLECDDVIYAVPPSTWSKVRCDPAIPDTLRPQMGVNVKFLAEMKTRFWLAEGRSQYSLTDGPLSMTWEGTDGQPGDENVALNCFSGGPAAQTCVDFPPDARGARYAKLLEAIYPGAKEQLVKSRFMNWPRDPWTLAGYSFPAPGQITSCGPLLAEGLDRLHFAGEHACYKFVGYMEGALCSGVNVARKLAQRDGILNR